MAVNTETEDSMPKGEAVTVSGSSPASAFAPGDFMDRTFLGGMSLSARISLFVLIGLACLAFGGFGLFRAERDLSAAQRQMAAAYELTHLAGTVEATAWRIRAEGILAKQKAPKDTPQSTEAIETHIAKAIGLGRLLDDMYSRFDNPTLGDHISTIREALAQYAEAYGAVAGAAEQTGSSGKADLALAVQTASRDLQDRVTRINILSLNKTIADMREAEAAFIENGQAGSLIAIANNQDAFIRLLAMVPLPETDTAGLRSLMESYQQRLTEYAKGRISVADGTGRLGEIFSYMVPSINSLRLYADQQLAASARTEARIRNFYQPLIAAVGAGLLLLVLLTGALILRSISGPLSAAAESGRRIAGGEDDVVVWGLGNDDETGDIARALSVLKLRLGEMSGIRESLEKEKSEAERGRAATEEAAWLRHDLESMKAELAKGQAAIDEVELLHKVIEAMRSDYQENAAMTAQAAAQARDVANSGPEPVVVDPAPEVPSMDTISQISQQVAQSSQTVTAAAEEAERTGTLIRNLNDASKRISGIEALIKTIGNQADLLWVGAPGGDSEATAPGGNLVMFSQDLRGDDEPVAGPRPDRPEMESSIGRRFDVIRATASQTTWALRDINGVIMEARNLALTIAQTSSAEALNVTTDLLEQSENLRYMLDSLVHKMRDQLFDEGGEIEKPSPGDQDVS